MKLVDTHAHPHMKGYEMPPEEMLAAAAASGVEKIICVGTDAGDSKRAISFTAKYAQCYASVGLHPHDAKLGEAELAKLPELVTASKVVAIGECGLDYYYGYSSKEKQLKAFRFQVELALTHNLPLIFHVRETLQESGDPTGQAPKGSKVPTGQAFGDFFKIVDQYKGIRGVVHSFTSTAEVMEKCAERGLYMGLNGIMTFSKDKNQLETARQMPLRSMVLETDAPFLTPHPKRGTINNSANVRIIAEFLADLRGESLEKLADVTTNNAKALFNL